MKYCSVNGIEQTSIALNDRGLAYGDGLFTTAKISQWSNCFIRQTY